MPAHLAVSILEQMTVKTKTTIIYTNGGRDFNDWPIYTVAITRDTTSLTPPPNTWWKRSTSKRLSDIKRLPHVNVHAKREICLLWKVMKTCGGARWNACVPSKCSDWDTESVPITETFFNAVETCDVICASLTSGSSEGPRVSQWNCRNAQIQRLFE